MLCSKLGQSSRLFSLPSAYSRPICKGASSLTLNNWHIIIHCPKIERTLSINLKVMVIMEIWYFRITSHHGRRVSSPENTCKTCITQAWCHKSCSQLLNVTIHCLKNICVVSKHEEILVPDIWWKMARVSGLFFLKKGVKTQLDPDDRLTPRCLFAFIHALSRGNRSVE